MPVSSGWCQPEMITCDGVMHALWLQPVHWLDSSSEAQRLPSHYGC